MVLLEKPERLKAEGEGKAAEQKRSRKTKAEKKVQKPHPLRAAKDGPPPRQRLKQEPSKFKLRVSHPPKFSLLPLPTGSGDVLA
jgi:hypothetical protein